MGAQKLKLVIDHSALAVDAAGEIDGPHLQPGKCGREVGVAVHQTCRMEDGSALSLFCPLRPLS